MLRRTGSHNNRKNRWVQQQKRTNQHERALSQALTRQISAGTSHDHRRDPKYGECKSKNEVRRASVLEYWGPPDKLHFSTQSSRTVVSPCAKMNDELLQMRTRFKAIHQQIADRQGEYQNKEYEKASVQYQASFDKEVEQRVAQHRADKEKQGNRRPCCATRCSLHSAQDLKSNTSANC